MVGRVTKKLIRDGCFPQCLSESFAGKRPDAGLETASDPYEQYWDRKWMFGVAVCGLVLMAVMGTKAFHAVYFAEESPLSASPFFFTGLAGGTVSLSFFVSYYTGCNSGSGGYNNDLRTFESRLEEVIEELKAPKGSRAPHLLYLQEAKDQATKVLVYYAWNILAYEKTNGKGCEKAEEMRAKLRNAFDLFGMYGLIDAHHGYAPYYKLAEEEKGPLTIAP